MVVKPFDREQHLEELFTFCKKCYTETSQPAHKNMWDDNWEFNSNTLPYNLLKTTRFSSPNGQFNLLFDENEIVACSGIYVSDFCKDIAISGCRTWVSPQYRHKSLVRNMLLPYEKSWAIRKNLKAIALTFNTYNKNIPLMWKRSGFGRPKKGDPESNLFYKNMNIVDFLVWVQRTPQYVVYEQLDENFYYDWNTIRVN